MVRLRKTPRACDLVQHADHQSAPITPATSNEGRRTLSVKSVASGEAEIADIKLPRPKKADSFADEPYYSGSDYSGHTSEVVEKPALLPKPVDIKSTASTTLHRVQKRSEQQSSDKSCKNTPNNRDSSSRSSWSGTTTAADGANDEQVGHTSQHQSSAPYISASNIRPTSEDLNIACGRGCRSTEPISKANNTPTPDQSQRPTKDITANELSEMYASCIPTHPAMLPARKCTSILSSHSQDISYPVGDSNESMPSTSNKCEVSFAASNGLTTNGGSGSGLLYVRQFFSKQLQRPATKKPWLDRSGRFRHISEPFVTQDQIDMYRLKSRPYEALGPNGEQPIHVRSATCPRIIQLPRESIEALPKTSAQFSSIDSSSNAQGRRATTWSFLKSFTSKTTTQSSKAHDGLGKDDSSSASMSDTQRRLLIAQAHRKTLHDSYFDTNDTDCTVEKRTPPEIPPRPALLWSASDASPEQRYSRIQLSDSSLLASTPEESTDEDESSRIRRHRRRAYYTLDGVTRSHPNRRHSKLDTTGAGISKFSSTTTSTKRNAKPPEKLSEREMLALHRAETAARPDSSTLPPGSISEASDNSSVSPKTKIPVPTSRTWKRRHHSFEQPIVSKHASACAWWEEFPAKSAHFQDRDSIHTSDLERSESPSVRPKTRGAKDISSDSSSRRAGARVKSIAHTTRISNNHQERQARSSQSKDVLRNASQKHHKSHPDQTRKQSSRPDRQQSTRLAPSTSGREELPKVAIKSDSQWIRGSLNSDQSTSPDENNRATLSSSDSSVVAKATALRHGKALKGFNEYEAAHAIESNPDVQLSQSSLGLTVQVKSDITPKPLRKMILSVVHKQSSNARKSRPASDEHSHYQSQRRPPTPPARTNSSGTKREKSTSPPPVPPRSNRRPQLHGDCAKDTLQDLKLDILGERSGASYNRPSNLSTIAEEARSMLSGSEITAIRLRSSAALSVVSDDDDDASTSSADVHDEHWWSENDERTKEREGPPISSKNTTPEKDGVWNNDAPEPSQHTADDADADADDENENDPAQEILQYYLDKQRRAKKRDPKERLRREVRRQAMSDDKQARLVREARDGKMRADVAEVEIPEDDGDGDVDGMMRDVSAAELAERAERVRGFLRGMRRDSVEGGWI